MAEEFDKEFDELDKMLAEDPAGELSSDGEAVDGVMKMTISDAVRDSVAVDKIAESMTKGFLSGLPNNTGEAISEAIDVGSEVMDKISEGMETVKKATSGLLGSFANVLPEPLATPINRLREWLGGEEDTPGRHKEPSEDEKIKQEVTSLFGEVINAQTRLQEIEAKENQLVQLSQQELLSKIVATNQESLGLKLKYDIVYQRRDLELSIKRTILLTKIYDVMTKFSDLSTKQLEAIVKNTALPDFAKYNSLSYLKENITRKMLDKTGSLFINNNFVSGVTKRLKDIVNSKIQDVVSGMDMPKSMLDMIADQKEFVEPGALLADMLLSTARDKMANKVMEPFVKGLMKSESGIESYKKLEELRSDPSKFFKELAKQQDTDKITGETKEKIFNFLSDILRPYEQTETIQLFDKSGLEKGTMFDNKTKTAIVKVIPTLLSKILQEVRAIRKGSKTTTDKDLEHFDYSKNKFITRRELKQESVKKIKEEAKDLGRTFNNNILEYLVGNRIKKLTDKQKMELFVKFNDYVMSGHSLSPFAMYRDFLPMIDDEKLREYVKKNLNVMVNNKESIEQGEHIKAQKEFEYYKYNKLTNFKDTAVRLTDLGAEDLIEELGLGDATALDVNKVMDYNKKYGKLGLKELKGKLTDNGKETKTISKSTDLIVKDSTTPVPEVKAEIVKDKKSTFDCCKDIVSTLREVGNSIVKAITKINIPKSVKIEETKKDNKVNTRNLVSNIRVLETRLNVPHDVRRQSLLSLNKIATIKDNYLKEIFIKSYAESITTSTLTDKLSLIAKFTKGIETKVSALVKIISRGLGLKVKDNKLLSTIKPDDNILELNKPDKDEDIIDVEVVEDNKSAVPLLKDLTSGIDTKFIKNVVDKTTDKVNELKSKIKEEIKQQTTKVTKPTPNSNYLMGGLTTMNTLDKKQKEELRPSLGIDMETLGIGKLRNELTSVIGDITTTFSSVRVDMAKTLKKFRETLPKTVEDMKSDLETTFKDVKESVNKFYKDSIEPIINDVSKTITETVGTQFKEFKAKLSEENKERLEKVENYIKESKQDIKEIVDTVTNKFKTYKESPEELKKDIIEVKENVKKQAQQVKDNLKDVIKDPNKAKEFFDLKIEDVKDFVKDKLGEERTNKIEEVIDKIKKNTPVSVEEVEQTIKDIKKSLPKNKKSLLKSVNKLERKLKSKIKKGIKYFNISPKKASESVETILNFIDSHTPIEITEDTKKKAKSTTSNTVKKVKHLGKTITNKVSEALSSVNDIDVEFLRSTKHIEELINEKGVRKILKKELLNIPLPITYNEAVTVYRGLFNTLDPSGETWEELYKNDPKLVDKLRELHMETIEDARKGLIEKGLDAIDTGVDKTVTGLSKLRDKLLTKLPEPLRRKIEPLLKNRFTNLAGDITKRTTKAGVASLKLFKDEMSILGKEGIRLFIDPRTGRLHLPRLTDLIRFTGKSYIHTTKSLSKSLKVLYPELFGTMKTVGKTALKTMWDVSGIGKAMTRAKLLAKAKLNPPIDRNLYKLWLKGELTGKQILNMLETEEEKERWENFLRAIAPRGITLADFLLKTGKLYYKSTLGLSKGIRYSYPKIFKTLYNVSKATGKLAWTFSGLGSLGKRALARIKPPIDRELYKAWREGKLTTAEVMELLPDYKKDIWTNYIRSITPYSIPLPDVMYKTGKDIFGLVFKKPKESVTSTVKNLIYKISKIPSKMKETFTKASNNIKDFFDRKTLGTVPIKFIKNEENLEAIGELFKSVLPSEYKGFKQGDIIDSLVEKVHSRKALRVIKNNLIAIETSLNDLDNPNTMEDVEKRIFEIADAIIMDKHKENKRKLKKESKIKEREEIIRKYTENQQETDDNTVNTESKDDKIQKLKKDSKVLTFLDLFLNNYLKEQLDFLAYRITEKNFDISLLDKLNNKLDNRYKRLINAIKKYTELFVGYRNEVHEDKLAVESAADELIGILAKVKINKLQEPKEVLEEVKTSYKSGMKKDRIVLGKEKDEAYTGMRAAFVATGTKTTKTETDNKETSVDEFEDMFKRMFDILGIKSPTGSEKMDDKIVKPTKKELKDIKETNKKTEEEQVKVTEDLKQEETKQTSILEKMVELLQDMKSNTIKTFSPFDKDKDGDRDGNWKDRLAKLYGKAKDKVKSTKEKNKSKDNKNNLLSTLLKFLPMLVAGFKPLVKLAGKLILEGIKSLGGLITKGIGKLLGSLGDKILGGIKGITGFIGDKLKNLFHFGSGVKTIASKIKDKFTKVISKTKPIESTTTTVKKGNIFTRAFGWIKDKAVSVKNKIVDGVSHLLKNSKIRAIASKIKNFIPKLKSVAIKKLGPKAAGELLSKLGSKLIPGIGLALFAWEAVNVMRYLSSGLSFPSAVSKALLGIDLFSSDKQDDKQETPKTETTKVEEPKLKEVVDKTKGIKTKLTVDEVFKQYGLDPDKGFNWKDLTGKTKLDIAKAIMDDKDNIYFTTDDGVMYRVPNPKNKPIDVSKITNPDVKQFAKSLNTLINKKEKTEKEKQLLNYMLSKDKFENLTKAKSLEIVTKRLELENAILTTATDIEHTHKTDNKISHTKLTSKERELVNKFNKHNNDIKPNTKTNIQQAKSNMLSKVHVTVNDKSEKHLIDLVNTANRSVNEQVLTNKNLTKLIELNQELVKMLGDNSDDKTHTHHVHKHKHSTQQQETEPPKAPVDLKSRKM